MWQLCMDQITGIRISMATVLVHLVEHLRLHCDNMIMR